LAGLFHDVGKMAIPEQILSKPAGLTEAEFCTVRQHPVEGAQMLRLCPQISALVLDVCLHHHEKSDGSGYPLGLAQDQISLFAQMGAVCDVYDAITSERPYKQGWGPAEAIQKMAEWKGHFDARVFQAFVRCVGLPHRRLGTPGKRAHWRGRRTKPRVAADPQGQGVLFGAFRHTDSPVGAEPG